MTPEQWDDLWWQTWNDKRESGHDGQAAAGLAEREMVERHGPCPVGEPAALLQAAQPLTEDEVEALKQRWREAVRSSPPVRLVSIEERAPRPPSMRGWLAGLLHRVFG